MADGVAGILKEVLVIEMRGEGVALVAEEANLSYDDVYAQTHERVNPSVHVIRAAFLVVEKHRPELLHRIKRLLVPDGYELVPAPMGITPEKDVEPEVTDVLLAAGEVIQEWRSAYADGRITKPEAEALRGKLDNLEIQLAEAKKVIEMNLPDQHKLRSV